LITKLKIFIAFWLYASFALAQSDNWTQLGMVKFPQNPSVQTTGMGRVSHMAFHPSDSNILYAASASGGLWRSSNEGKTWSPLCDALPYVSCASVCVNHKNPKTLYLGTGDANYYGGGLGVYKSTDEGKTWKLATLGMGSTLVVQIVMHPNDTNILVATTKNGIYKSVNSGATWIKKSSITDNYNDLARKPKSKTGLYATSLSAFYYSDNFGDTWTQQKISATDTFTSLMIGVSNVDSNLVYVTAWRGKSWGNKTYFGGVYKSKNAGRNWKLQSNTPQILGYSGDGSSNDGQGGYNLTMTVDPTNAAHVYVGAINLWKSTDSAKTWRQQSHWAYGVHADKHHYIFSPFNSKKVFITHDGGIDRSGDTGKSWKTITDGLTASEFYKMGQSKLNREKLLGGLQDNGLNYYKDGIFYTIRGGDYGGEFLFDHLDSTYQYFQGGGNKYDLNNFGNYSINGQPNGIYELHNRDTNLMFMANNHLYLTVNCRANPSTDVKWTRISDSITHYGGTGSTAIARSKTNGNFLYWSKSNGVLYRVDQVNSKAPNFVSLTKPSGVISQISTYSKDSNVVYITIGSKIYKSENKGKSWSDITKNLPALNIVSMQIDDRTNDSSIYVANVFGVYFKNKTKSNWVLVSKNLPAIAGITDMEVFNDGTPQSCIRISTYGRGIWQSSLYPYQTATPVADFSIASTSSEACPKNFLINDLSGGSSYTRQWNIIPNTGYTFINQTDSTSRIAELAFTKPGIYTITLTVSNAFGTHSLSKTQIISELAVKPTCKTSTTLLGNYSIGIYNFEFAGINKSSAYSVYSNPNYEDFTCSDMAVVKPGNKYTAYVTNGNSYNETVNIYIDYNNDGDFSGSNELAGSIAFGKGKRSVVISILGAPPVQNTFIRMRVVSDYNTITGPCGTLSYGQSEDYSLYIDNRKPGISLSIPKPIVYGSFLAGLKFSEFVGPVDTSKIKFKNASVIGFTRLSPISYLFNLKPILPSYVSVNVAANQFKDMVGNLNGAFADSTFFEFGLNSFTFPGYSKTDSIFHTLSGGSIKSYVYAATNLDSLVAKFEISDSAKLLINGVSQISEVSKNSYLQPVALTLKSQDGLITKTYDVKVIKLKDTLCVLDSLICISPETKGQINQASKTISLVLPYKTALSSKTLRLYFSPKAKVWVNNILHTNGLSIYDLSKVITFKIIAEDSLHFTEYTLRTSLAKNTACELLAWNFKTTGDTGIITQTLDGGFVNVKVPFGTNLNNLVANFILSDSALAEIKNQFQTSGISSQNYEDTVLVKVLSQDGNHIKRYKIKVNISPNTQCLLKSFDFTQPAISVQIIQDTLLGKVKIEVAENTNLQNLTAVFKVSDSAKAFINSTLQVSGSSVNNYSNPIIYKVVAQDGVSFKNYEVSIRKLVGIYDLKQNLFHVYPNPGTDIFHIEWSIAAPGFQVEVYDISGKLILTQADRDDLDLSAYDAGVYTLILQTKGIRQVSRIVKL
jgi:photosystem II stability/assembly factor-like uncharacterized protein